MKDSDIVVGNIYAAKVSSKIQPVTVIERVERFVGTSTRSRWRTAYLCRNTRTGRRITVRSPQRFRAAWEDHQRQLAADSERGRETQARMDATRKAVREGAIARARASLDAANSRADRHG